MKKIFALLCAACMLTASLSACSNDSDSMTVEEGKLLMATNATFPPYEYYDGNDVVGIDAEIAAKIAEKLGLELEIQDMEFNSIITSVNQGKADMGMAGMTVSEDRLKNVDFSDPYYSTTQVILVRSDEAEITSSADLKGKTVGVQTGTTGDTYATDADKEHNHGIAEVKRYNKFMDATSDLIAGRLDAVIVDDFPADKLIERNPDKIKKLDEELTGEDYAIAVPKGDTEMLNTVNEVLDELEESGELDEIFDKYLQ